MSAGHGEDGATAKTPPFELLTIREFHISDYEDALDVWRRANVNLRLDGRDSLESLERQLRFMGPFMLVAEMGGKVVGVALGSHDGMEGFINRIAVHPDYRRRRIATRLIEEAERRLIDKGVESIILVAETDKQESIEAFKKMGFTERLRVSYMMKRDI